MNIHHSTTSKASPLLSQNIDKMVHPYFTFDVTQKERVTCKHARKKRIEEKPRQDKCSNLFSNCERRHVNHVLNKFSSF